MYYIVIPSKMKSLARPWFLHLNSYLICSLLLSVFIIFPKYYECLLQSELLEETLSVPENLSEIHEHSGRMLPSDYRRLIEHQMRVSLIAHPNSIPVVRMRWYKGDEFYQALREIKVRDMSDTQSLRHKKENGRPTQYLYIVLGTRSLADKITLNGELSLMTEEVLPLAWVPSYSAIDPNNNRCPYKRPTIEFLEKHCLKGTVKNDLWLPCALTENPRDPKLSYDKLSDGHACSVSSFIEDLRGAYKESDVKHDEKNRLVLIVNEKLAEIDHLLSMAFNNTLHGTPILVADTDGEAMKKTLQTVQYRTPSGNPVFFVVISYGRGGIVPWDFAFLNHAYVKVPKVKEIQQFVDSSIKRKRKGKSSFQEYFFPLNAFDEIEAEDTDILTANIEDYIRELHENFFKEPLLIATRNEQPNSRGVIIVTSLDTAESKHFYYVHPSTGKMMHWIFIVCMLCICCTSILGASTPYSRKHSFLYR